MDREKVEGGVREYEKIPLSFKKGRIRKSCFFLCNLLLSKVVYFSEDHFRLDNLTINHKFSCFEKHAPRWICGCVPSQHSSCCICGSPPVSRTAPACAWRRSA